MPESVLQRRLGVFSCLFVCCFCLSACSHFSDNSGAGTQSGTPGNVDRLPSNIKKHAFDLSCPATVLNPAKFRDTVENVLVFEGSPTYTNKPAEITWGTIRIQTEPARFPQETIPSQYREVTEKIESLRERTKIVGQNAQYKTVIRPVTTVPAYTRWKEGCTNAIAEKCLEKIPAQVITLKRESITHPARVFQKRIPAKVVEVNRKILIKRGKGTGKPIPAKYQHVRVGRVSKIWQITAEPQASRYEKVPVKLLIRPERIRRLPALCENNAKPAQVLAIQQRLKQLGYKVYARGKITRNTLSAIQQFQRDEDLAIGAITLETLRKLGLM